MMDRRDSLLLGLREKLSQSGHADDAAVRAMIEDLLLKEREKAYIDIRERRQLADDLFAAVRGLDILQPLIEDPRVTEIMVNGPEDIYVEREGVISRWPLQFRSREKLEDIIQQIVGACDRVINERQPIADARLPDGSRVNAVIAPVALDGPILTIRRFPEDPITMDKLIAWGAVTEEAADELRTYVVAGYSILISGGTSAGKTTFLNALSQFVPAHERIITIEDNAELQIRGIPNLVRLEAKAANMEGNAAVTIRDLIRTALRMRPDRLIVGEVRGEEAAELLVALNTGHRGSLSTIHANSAYDTLSRLETLVLMAMDIPLRAIRSQIRSGIDLIVYLGRLPDRSRRVLEIAEIVKEEGFEAACSDADCSDAAGAYAVGSNAAGDRSGEILLNPLYRWDDREKTLVRIGGIKQTGKLVRAGFQL